MKDQSFFRRIQQEFQSDREKVRGRSVRYKLEYFFMYYKVPVILTIAAAAILFSIIYSRSQYKEYAFQAFLVNAKNTIYDETLEQKFGELAEIDTEKYQISIDSSLFINGNSQAAIASTEKLSASVNSQLADICVMPEELFLLYAEQGLYGDLQNFLTEEQLEEYEELILYQNGIPVGIRAEKFHGIAEAGLYSAEDMPVFGIVYNTRHQKECSLFLDFLSAISLPQ